MTTGSSLNPAAEIKRSSGADGVEQGMELGGRALSVQARHQCCRVTAGASHERAARKALGQQGSWGGWDSDGPPLWPVVGAGIRR